MKAPSGVKLRGVFVQARRADDRGAAEAFGSFSVADSNNFKTIDCHGQQGSNVSYYSLVVPGYRGTNTVPTSEFVQTARNLETNANVTFDSRSKPRVTFAFAFPRLWAVCTNSTLSCAEAQCPIAY